MEILNKDVTFLAFSDIDAFCQEGHLEGIQIDYKQSLPKDGLAKHFAAFSNTRGGIIIIGVEEDKTGKPAKWEGIALDSKLIDRIHQYAASVDPIPTYKVHHTDERNGKVFILVRIYEGHNTPYYVQNDPRIYVRTGNITSLIDLASRDATELLFGKKVKAKIARESLLRKSTEIYKDSLERAEKERLAEIAQWSQQHSDKDIKESGIYSKKLGTEAAIATIAIQPYYPHEPLAAPRDIKGKVQEFRFDRGHYGGLPDHNVNPIQDGIMRFFWSQHDGAFSYEQLDSTGLVFFKWDILRVDKDGRQIFLAWLFGHLFVVLSAAKNFYSLFGYQGTLIGLISLEGIKDVTVWRLNAQSRMETRWDIKKGLQENYEWKLDLDTSLLNDPQALQEYFKNLEREIYWTLGYEDENEGILNNFLKENGWLVE